MRIRNGARPLWQEMRIKCVAAVANSRSGTGDGERGAELHQPPSFSAVPPSPAKRVCVCHSGGRESRPPAGPHLGNASEHGRLAWLSAVSQSHAPLGIVWERVQNTALPLTGRRRFAVTHTQVCTWKHECMQTSTVACYTMNLRRAQSCHGYTTHLVARIFALMVCLLV